MYVLGGAMALVYIPHRNAYAHTLFHHRSSSDRWQGYFGQVRAFVVSSTINILIRCVYKLCYIYSTLNYSL